MVWNNVAPNAPHNAFRNAPFAISTEDVDGGEQTLPIVASVPGTFPYFCAIHGAGMAGTLIVQEAAAVDESAWSLVLLAGGVGAVGLVAWRKRPTRLRLAA